MITGNDPISLNILNELEHKKIKLKDMPGTYDISLDQAKRLSRFSNLIQVAKQHLTESAMDIILTLGLKTLVLSQLFKQQDWEGLEEILSACDATTTRDTLKKLIASLVEKRERIEEFKEEANWKIESLERKKKELENKSIELHILKEEVENSVKDFNKYNKEVKQFFLEHLGINDGDFVLIKRIDSGFRKRLETVKALYYHSGLYCHLIKDLDVFATELEKRMNKGNYIYWDYEREYERSSGGRFGRISDDPYYRNRNNQSLVEDGLDSRINELEKEQNDAQKEIKKTVKEIKKLKKESVHSFMEAAEASNTLSVREIKHHAELQIQAGRWLFSKGYVVAFEVTFPNGRRADVIGFNEDNEIVVIEVKVSMNDFNGDKKWRDYLPYCDTLYFCSDLYLHSSFKENFFDDDKVGAGFLHSNGHSIEIAFNDQLNHQVKEREKTIFSIAKTASKKLIYGY